jgi:UDP-N-acetylmuramoyl-L-alanyl-D-glutamate--2,6-diaminopimelate ligase
VKLHELFQSGQALVPDDAAGVEVRSLAVDSRAVAAGALFAALPGVKADGAAFAQAAVERGAAAVLSARPLQLPVPVVVAANPRRAFSLAAARFHGQPSEKLQLLGVTGTNGKTTTTWLVEQLSTARGLRAGLLGTVEVRFAGQRLEATHTTPESHELQALLARMAAAGVQVAAMEVSSHALEQERAAGCRFAGAAFTNLTRDHLDYHGTMEAYFAAKARLFRELLPEGAPAVINVDDPWGQQLADELRAARRLRVLGFSTRGAPSAELRAGRIESGLSGLSFELNGVRVKSPLIGAHNVENLLTAFGLLHGLGAPIEDLAAHAPIAHGAPGRLERVLDPQGRHVFVDYAHSDDALARVLDALRDAAASRKAQAASRLIVVFGCGGDRDRGKRPLMGEAAGRRAQLSIATSDNPRTEDPLAILADVEPGLRKSGGDYRVEPDRRRAIALALEAARPGDAVLIAGKGHETYQIVGHTKHAFDDRVEAAQALAALGGGRK